MTTHKAAPMWLRVLVALLAAINVVGMVGALANMQMAPPLPPLPVSPLAQLIVSSVFLLIFAWLLIGLQRRISRLYAAAAPVLTGYALFGLAWNLLLTRSAYSRETFGFDVLITVLILLSVWWTAWRRGWLRGAPNPRSMQQP